MQPLLEVNNLSKRFKKFQAVDQVSFSVNPGEIMGFLGPNGAGKTTCIKMITGFLYPDSGDISICGFRVDKQFEKAMSKVGAIVENPGLYREFSGWKNLKLYSRMLDNASNKRLKEVVRLVGLEERIHDKVKKYSLGMCQRLGLALALLGDPDVLILDEPTNGLDPEGIQELRHLLKNLAHEQGKAVLVSSHLLSEMELLCDRICIIQRGQLLGIESVESITSGKGKNTTSYLMVVDRPQEACEMLTGRGLAVQNSEEGLQFTLPMEKLSGLLLFLLKEGIQIYSVSPRKTSLERVYLEVTKGGDHA